MVELMPPLCWFRLNLRPQLVERDLAPCGPIYLRSTGLCRLISIRLVENNMLNYITTLALSDFTHLNTSGIWPWSKIHFKWLFQQRGWLDKHRNTDPACTLHTPQLQLGKQQAMQEATVQVPMVKNSSGRTIRNLTCDAYIQTRPDINTINL